MTTDERIEKLEKRVEQHEEKINCLEKKQMKDTYDLKAMIVDAVNQSIKPLITKIEEQGKDQRIINEAQDKRISALENAEAQKALKNSQEIWKTIKSVIITAIITFFLSILLNNFIASITESINNENISMEVREWQKQNEVFL